MRVFFAAGGTAGHINPAIAVAQLLRKKYPGAVFLFAAVPGGMEERLIPEAGFETVPLEIKGLQRRLSLENLKRIGMVPRAVRRAKNLLRSFAPDLVFATGGYLSYPVAKAAARLKIPCILHESNAVPGLTVRLLAKKASLVLLNYPEAKRHLSRNCNILHVGNPLRADFGNISKTSARTALGVRDGECMILSFGGSLGADRLNRACIGAMMQLSKRFPRLRWLHACGEKKYEECLAMMNQMGVKNTPRTEIRPYIHDMALSMAAADIVVCRAGAVTVTELSVLGKAAILVPFPGAVNQHQAKNAEAVRAGGGCIVCEDENLTEERLTELLIGLINNPEKRRRMETAIRRHQPPDCENLILESIENHL